MKTRIGLFILFMIAAIFYLSQPEKEKYVLIQQTVFDKALWSVKVGTDYPQRNLMLDDVRNNIGLKQLGKKEILDLLGKPERSDNEYLFYQISQERLGFFPLHTKTLVIKLSTEEGGNKIMIHK